MSKYIENRGVNQVKTIWTGFVLSMGFVTEDDRRYAHPENTYIKHNNFDTKIWVWYGFRIGMHLTNKFLYLYLHIFHEKEIYVIRDNGLSIENTTKYTVIIVAAIFLFLSGCIGGDKIGDILQNPEKYNGKTVNIKGTVTDELSVPFVSQGAYKVDDDTGSIWVITTRGTPTKDKEVSVEGTVRIAFSIGGINLGIVIFENVRESKMRLFNVW